MEYDPKVREKALKHMETHGLAPTHRRIAAMVAPGGRVLDVGCATGYLAEPLSADKCRVTGIEMDAAAAEKARTHCVKVVTGDAGDPAVLRTAGDGFDTIICADILEHLADPWTVLRTLREMLVPGGQLLVSVPNVAYWRMRWDLLMGRFNYTDTGLLDRTHLRFFTVKTFRETAQACGFDVNEMIVNDGGLPGFPHPVDWDRLPRWIRAVVKRLSNVCVFHAIYRLVPAAPGGDTGRPRAMAETDSMAETDPMERTDSKGRPIQ